MSKEISQQNKKALRALDLLVAVSLPLLMLMSLVATFIKDQASIEHWLEEHAAIVRTLAIVECAILLLWMCLGGQKSNLWNWLPPFCFFPKALWIRWLIITGLIAGTLAGMIASSK